MKSLWQLLSVFLLLLSSPVSAANRYFASTGPTATETYGFQGGWGVSLGFDRRIAEPASFLVRADFTSLPSSRGGGPPIIFVPHSPLALGESGPDAATALLGDLMFGLRLKPTGRVRPYLDALIGVGHLNDPAQSSAELRSGTNTVLSFGTGVELPRIVLGSPFAEVRYDFYFVSGISGPVIPVRLGFMVP